MHHVAENDTHLARREEGDLHDALEGEVEPPGALDRVAEPPLAPDVDNPDGLELVGGLDPVVRRDPPAVELGFDLVKGGPSCGGLAREDVDVVDVDRGGDTVGGDRRRDAPIEQVRHVGSKRSLSQRHNGRMERPQAPCDHPIGSPQKTGNTASDGEMASHPSGVQTEWAP